MDGPSAAHGPGVPESTPAGPEPGARGPAGGAGDGPALDRLLARALSGEPADWPVGAEGPRVLERAAFHGIRGLILDQIGAARLRDWGWPEALIQGLREAALAQAAWELRHGQLLRESLAHLTEAGARPLLFKGSALAYGLYTNPATRARGDSDLIVAPSERCAAFAVLEGLSFIPYQGHFAESITSELSFTRPDPWCGDHCLDLHWRLSNSPVIAGLFSHGELLAHSVPIPALGPQARGAGRPHALAIACVHRLRHAVSPYYVNGVAYLSADRLIWLYDIKLLVESMDEGETAAFIALARERRIQSVCGQGIALAQGWLDARVPAHLTEAFRATPADEPIARYLGAGPLRTLWMDLEAMAGVANKARYLGQYLFPPRELMDTKYPGARSGWIPLPLLHLRRIAGGAWKRIARGQGPRERPG